MLGSRDEFLEHQLISVDDVWITLWTNAKSNIPTVVKFALSRTEKIYFH